MARGCCATRSPAALPIAASARRGTGGAPAWLPAPATSSSGCALSDAMLPLHGVGVLVTRPRTPGDAAVPCCSTTRGASTFRLPAIEIKPLTDRRALAARLGPLENFDLIIFTSANAVRFGAVLLDQKRNLTSGRHRPRDRARVESSRLPGGRAAHGGFRFRRSIAASEIGARGGQPDIAHQGRERPGPVAAGTRAPRRDR